MMILFFMELATRKVQGIDRHANGLWMEQIGRNLSDGEDGILRGKKYLIHDRDPLFTEKFVRMLADAGVECVKLPPKSPNLNSYAERFVTTIKESCLEKVIWFGEDALRKGVQDFMVHYHRERNHQGLENRLIEAEEGHLGATGEIQQRQRLGGLLNYYYRSAA